MKQNHPFHIVSISPWPMMASLSLMNSMINASLMMSQMKFMLTMNLLSLILNMGLWWRDIVWESMNQGMHTKKVINGLRMGMLMFILSEILFFMSLFWLFLHSSISPSINIGMDWPPKNIITFNPLDIPLMNTIILLSSGIFITVSHYSLMMNNLEESVSQLFMTINMGIIFSTMQIIEYSTSSFTIADSIYGSTFFLVTGFHGIHVIIGTMFLLVTIYRMIKNQINSLFHLNFEFAAWYWHFVDVVWLFVYTLIYFN